MDSAHVAVALVNNTAFVVCVLFVTYLAAVVPAFVRRGEPDLGRREDHEWHVVVPCLDEERVVVGTVEHLVEAFPEAHVWCVDDASDDSTPQLLAWLARRHPTVHVVTRRTPDARLGKGPALNAAWREISASVAGRDRDRVVVGVLDADGRLDPLALDVLAGPALFGDPAIGAVQIQVRVTEDVDALAGTVPRRLAESAGPGPGGTDRDRLLVRLQDLEFSGPIAGMQFLRRRTGSVAMGGNGQFTRLSALDAVAAGHGTPWHGALLEDFELGLHVLLAGWRTEYCHDTFVAQTGPTTLRPLFRQRTRWSQGSIQCTRYLWRVLRSTAVPLSGALEIAYYLYIPFSQVVGSVVFPVSAVIHLGYALAEPDGPDRWLVAGAWGLIPLALVFGVLPHAVWGLLYRSHGAGLVSRREATAMAVLNIGYGYLLQLCAWRALYRILRGRHDWAKTARAGEETGASPRARHPAPLLEVARA
jgi:cellulose synthase/poly-beta-1,6-N-acetylglucosamine synthase-like glycosyltransferase